MGPLLKLIPCGDPIEVSRLTSLGAPVLGTPLGLTLSTYPIGKYWSPDVDGEHVVPGCAKIMAGDAPDRPRKGIIKKYNNQPGQES